MMDRQPQTWRLIIVQKLDTFRRTFNFETMKINGHALTASN